MEKAYVHSSGCVKDGRDCLRHEVDSRVPRNPDHEESDGRASMMRTTSISPTVGYESEVSILYIHVNHEHGTSAMQVPSGVEHILTHAVQHRRNANSNTLLSL